MNQTLFHLRPSNNRFEISLPLNAVTLGIRQDQVPVVRPMGIPMDQVFYCTKGVGELRINQDIFHINPGCGFYLKKNVPHSYHPLEDNWELSYLGFEGPLCHSFMDTLQMSESCAFRVPDDTNFMKHLEKLSEIVHLKSDSHKLSTSALTYYSILELISHRNNILSVSKYQEESYLHRIMNYLQNHYARPISLDEVANDIGLSKEYMCTYFKKHMGQTIIHTLLDIRIMNACAFLHMYPEKKISEIASQCGFENTSYFCNVFKKHQGITPDAYRKQP